eukprot:SAG11_NODE_7888_length_1084_cov_1.415228_1_plen_217_part_10
MSAGARSVGWVSSTPARHAGPIAHLQQAVDGLLLDVAMRAQELKHQLTLAEQQTQPTPAELSSSQTDACGAVSCTFECTCTQPGDNGMLLGALSIAAGKELIAILSARPDCGMRSARRRGTFSFPLLITAIEGVVLPAALAFPPRRRRFPALQSISNYKPLRALWAACYARALQGIDVTALGACDTLALVRETPRPVVLQVVPLDAYTEFGAGAAEA